MLLATEHYDKPEAVNLGAGFEITIRELAELTRELTGYEGRLAWDTSRPNGQPRRSLDTSRAEREFGFKARTGFREGAGAHDRVLPLRTPVDHARRGTPPRGRAAGECPHPDRDRAQAASYEGLENWVQWRELRGWIQSEGLEPLDYRGFNALPLPSVHPITYGVVDWLDRFGNAWRGPWIINILAVARRPT